MDIIISSNVNEPIYEQISRQIKEMVMKEELKAGDLIPPMRTLARSLHVSVITVQHAYEDLQRSGFIETIVGKGSFIADTNVEIIKNEQLKRIEELTRKIVQISKENGLSVEKIHDLINYFYEDEKNE